MNSRATTIVILPLLAFLPACDNLTWGGMEFSLQPPAPPPSALPAEPERDEEGETQVLLPLELGPMVYLVERAGSEGRLLPVAIRTDSAYLELPSLEETPDLVQRFPLQRWEAGTEFVLLDRGLRVGTLVSDGSVEEDRSFCLPRPAGRGVVELRPGFEGRTSFLAVRKEDVALGQLPGRSLETIPTPSFPGAGTRTSAALSVARFILPRADILWPPSIPEMVRETHSLHLSGGEEALVTSYLFGDQMEVGPPAPTGYSLFVLATRRDGDWRPLWSWYQHARNGKAAPRLRGAGVLTEAQGIELLLEVLGEESRWLSIAGERDGEWGLRYQDSCGTAPPSTALRIWN